MVRHIRAVARRALFAGAIALVIGGCGIKGPLKAPPGSKAPPPPPPGVELPSASTPSD